MSTNTPNNARRLPGLRSRGAQVSNRGGNTLEQVAPNRRQIAVTSFDLLNGAYQVTARNRKISVILLAVVIVSVAWQGGHGLQNQLKMSNLEAQTLEMKERQRMATARFSATTGLPEGVDEQMLITRYELLTANLKQVSVSTATPFDVLATINDPGVSISSVSSRIRTNTKLNADKDAKEGDEKAEEDNTMFDEELFAGLNELKAGEVVVETKVTATAINVAELTRWAQRVRDAQIFANLVISRTGTVYTLIGVQVQSRTPTTLFTPWSQAGLPIALGAATSDDATEGEETP